MDIVLVSSEAVPFSKTGGLADVAGALPDALAQQGHTCTVIVPYYRQSKTCGRPLERTGVPFQVPIRDRMVGGHFMRSTMPGERVDVVLVEHNDYFDREQLYGTGGRDYWDNCERFVYFCRAVFEAIRLLNIPVDIIHANDWQTGLVPAYLKAEHGGRLADRPVGTVFTIHNMAYQGQFWPHDMPLTGLDWKYYNWRQMEAWGNINLLKTGIVFSDAVTTVSPRYAQEIQSPPLGYGLEGALQQRAHDIMGILNGVDALEWNPSTDPNLPVRYSADTVMDAKPVCKSQLQQELGLPVRQDVPLVGLVGRLVDQKGIDLVADVMYHWTQVSDVQWAILGTGDPHYHEFFSGLKQRFPDKVAAKFDFNNPLAHRIEGGADMFLMPSRFEPCGLSQLYSLKYGTVPIVRWTGGLANTVVDAHEATLAAGTANGFSFGEYNGYFLGHTLSRACDAFSNPSVWGQLVRTGMRQDWSWTRSAMQYSTLYEMTLSRLRRF